VEDQKIIRWSLKELLGYKNGLVFLEELQQTLLTLANQTSSNSRGKRVSILLLNLENKLEEIKSTVDKERVFDQTIKYINLVEEELKQNID
jgi:lipopolysaccharide biosynthesis regulator YciM